MTAVTNTRTRGTTAWQAFISLLKGYVGPGCLSLPWAISQLGLVVGTMSVFVVSYWTSLNIWHVVELKRAYQDELLCQEETDGTSIQEDHPETTHAFPQQQQQQPQITYPDVGHWLYGKRFAQFLTCMICMQQIAVCTVFLSFIGENLGAALEHIMGEALHHALVITFVLPSALLLTVCMSNLKVLAPIMTVATITLFAGFAVLFVLVFQAWPQRPQPYLVEIQDWANLPLAICAILYSFEGVCLILPIESSMTYGREHFGMVFVSAMVASAVIFAMVAAFCVMAFGRVSSGSITAFLVEQQQQEGADKEDNLEILNMANLLVSIAVLLTYPLQLFPSYELVGPAVAKYFTTNGGSTIGEEMEENSYVAANSDDEEGGRLHTTASPEQRHNIADDDASTTPVETPFSDEDLDPAAAPTRRSEEVPITDSTADTAGLDTATGLHPETSYWNYYGTSYGDTPTVRVGLVLVTYLFAIVVPNVQLLVSLAGAVSGSATGLLIPPMLQLAHWRKMEQRERQQQQLEEEEEERLSGQTTNTNSSSQVPVVAYGSWHYQQRRMQCYILFILGCIVLVIGTTSSLWDIIKVYRGVG